MSKLLFNTKYEFCLLKRRMNILEITVILVVSTGFGDDQYLGGGGGGGVMVVASMYPASRIAYVLNVYYCQACMSRETDHNLEHIVASSLVKHFTELD